LHAKRGNVQITGVDDPDSLGYLATDIEFTYDDASNLVTPTNRGQSVPA
jgi:YD repeat-containing protein